jgi:hypothetical protein
MEEEKKPKQGKEFWEFVRQTADRVSEWPECKQAVDASSSDRRLRERNESETSRRS